MKQYLDNKRDCQNQSLFKPIYYIKKRFENIIRTLRNSQHFFHSIHLKIYKE